MKHIGYTVGTIFIRSYEQGERVYTSMLCRGYGKDSHIFIAKKPLRSEDWLFLGFCLLFAITVPLTIWMTAIRLF